MGVGLCVFVFGCGPGGGDTPDGNGPDGNGQENGGTEADAHDHSQEGPHGGHLIVLGEEEYHVELLHDEATHTVTIHILDATGKENVAIDQTGIVLHVFQGGEFVTHTLAAVGGEDTSSEFSIADEKLCDLLLHSEELKGRVNVTVDGKDYVGMIDHTGHDHTGHAHGESEDDGHGHDGEGDGHDDDDEADHGHDDDGDEGHGPNHDGEDGDADHDHAEHGDADHDQAAHDEDGHGHDEDGDEGHSPNHDGDGHDEDSDADHGDHKHE
jgi:hypothetical protein